MTVEEVSKKIGLQPKTIENQFKRSQEKALRLGYELVRIKGEDKKWGYYIEKLRAPTLFLEEENQRPLPLCRDSMKWLTWDLMVFLGLCGNNQLVWRGHYDDFLKYLEINITKENLQLLQESLFNLKEKGYIIFIQDKSYGEQMFIAAISEKIEIDNHFYISRVKKCREIQKKNNMRSWIPLLKTWLIIDYLNQSAPNGIYTVKKISEETGLKESTIRDCTKKLREADVISQTLKYWVDNESEQVWCRGKSGGTTEETEVELGEREILV